jgi:hypothetical protein
VTGNELLLPPPLPDIMEISLPALELLSGLVDEMHLQIDRSQGERKRGNFSELQTPHPRK